MTRLDPDPLQVDDDPRVPHRPHVGCWPLVALGIALTLAWLIATPRSEPQSAGASVEWGTPSASHLALRRPYGRASDVAALAIRGAVVTSNDTRVASVRQGTWAFANPSHGARYLATPEPRGTRIRACGPLGCRALITNDVGPVLSLQRAGRIGDLSAEMFVAICGDLSRGLCVGSYTVLPALPPLPATDEEAKS